MGYLYVAMQLHHRKIFIMSVSLIMSVLMNTFYTSSLLIFNDKFFMLGSNRVDNSEEGIKIRSN